MPYFQGFHTSLATVAISMNPITCVMNFHCILLWHLRQSLLESNSDLPPLCFQRVQPWLNLRRRLLYPFNYGNKCRIFGLFSSFGYGKPYLWNQSLSWWIICFLFWLLRFLCLNRTLNWFLFHCSGFNHSCPLGGPRYIHLTKETDTNNRTFLLYQISVWMQYFLWEINITL